ncbi:MAG: hypothetical protein KAR47_17915, partial [Planctomycetes bacterium]|nr:hypothetical protein [Planctomycetota bacterium]
MVLTGPINGDDHFYVADLSGDQWKADAKTIDGNGVLGEVRDTLDDLGADIDNFTGTVATAGDPVWFVHYFASWLGWVMTPENIATRADVMAAEIQSWRDMLGGNPTRVNFAANLGSYVIGPDATDPDITAEGMVAFCAALAQHGVHFCLIIGHGPNVGMDAANLADCFEASIVDGECYMMARTRELKLPSYVDEYKPHMDAVLARADLLGVAPPKIMLCGKGAIFSAMSPTQAATYFPAYKDVMVLGVENSNVTVVDWSFSERAGMWLNGDVEAWGCNPIGDNLAANRIAEWGGMRNAHIVLRQMLSQYSMGADIFRVTSITIKDNPLYLRGDITDPAFAWSNPYRQGIVNFLKIVESGVYPCSPERDQIKGVSPVAAVLPAPNYIRLQEQSINHDYELYAPQAEDYVINNLACWAAYTDVPDFDVTAILLNTKRRWENLFPNSPGGFVPMVPYATRSELEAKPWCNRAYETDGDTWSEFASLTVARDTISAELDAQKSNLLFYVENECFWQVTQQKNDPDTYFAILMDSDTLTPTERTVKPKRGSATGMWAVYDQFGSQSMPLGTLFSADDEVSIVIDPGSVRILAITAVDGNPPDINGDGDVNLEDFVIMARHWLAPCSVPGWCEDADINLSGLVDESDLNILID